MRLFVAVELEEHVRRAAAAASAQVRKAAADLDARWIAEENLHITLVFLGEVGDDRVAAVRAALDVPFRTPPFSIDVGGAGAFPPSGPPRVLWLGVREGRSALAALHGEVSSRLAPLGFEPEHRKYSAHLTIARVRDVRRGGAAPRSLREALAACPADAGRSRVTAVTLYQSRLSPKGATYSPILRVPLDAGPGAPGVPARSRQ